MGLRLPLGVLAILLSAILSPSAFAGLLYAGGEDSDFLCNGSGTCSVTTYAATFRSGWARESYSAFGSTVDPATNRFATAPFASNSVIWVHAQYCTANLGTCGTGTTANAQMLRVIDANGNATLIVRGTGTAGQVKISSRTAGGTFTDLVTCSSAINATLMQFDMYINYGTSGAVTLYNNSQQACAFTGNVTNGDGATGLTQIEFSSPQTQSGNAGSGSWSEVIVATTDSRSMARFTANTTGNGNTTGFTGTNICSAIWNATAFNDANYGYSNASNVLHECTVNGTLPAGSYSVLGLVMSARALVGSTGPAHFDFMTRVNSTDYASSDYAPLQSFSNITNYIQTTNPATSSAWSVSDFAAAGFNVGEQTKP